MYYLRNFDKQADAVGQKAYLPTIAIVGGVNKVGYFDGDVSKNNVFTENDDFIKIGEAKETRVVGTYNVTQTTGATKICSATTNFASMEVDGVEVTTVTTGYTFTTTGEHIVKFTLKDNTTIGEEAFRKCQGLTSILIPDSVTTIEWCAFSECYSLTSIVIPDGVTTIGYNAFYYAKIASVTIPVSVTTIWAQAFGLCGSLNTIKYTGTVAQWKSITKGSGLFYLTPATEVTCADGTCSL